MKPTFLIWSVLSFFFLANACIAGPAGESPPVPSTSKGEANSRGTVDAGTLARGEPATTLQLKNYPWVTDWPKPLPPLTTLKTHFPVPAGYRRVPAQEQSYAHWLRHLPVRTDRIQVLSYRGRPLQRSSAALVLLDVGKRDLQQCADSAIRLHAEYLYSRGLAKRARYHFTSGQETRWDKWLAGERFVIDGRRVKRVAGRRRAKSHATYRKWLSQVFIYAGTRSLRLDSNAVGDDDIKGGDFLVHPGGPGHAVVILDVAQNEAGDRIGLIGQGFMPAEDFHVLRAVAGVDRVWFKLPPVGGAAIKTPDWPRPFSRDSARRFKVMP